MGKGLVDELKKDFDLEEEWVNYQLRPDTPPEGLPVEKRFSPEDMEPMMENLRRAGEPYGIKFGKLTVLANSRLALEACAYAHEKGWFDAFHERMFYAYFTEGRNIGEVDVILDVAKEVGLDTGEVKQALETRQYAEQIDQAAAEAMERQIRSIPTFIFNGQHRIVGAQSIKVFRDLLGKL